MPTISKILAPVDFSAGSKAAVEQALVFADRFNASLHVLHVWDVPQSLRPDLMVWLEGTDRQPVEAVISKQTNEELSAFLAEFPADVRGRITARAEQGNPVKRILHIAESEQFDLLVLGTHGRTGLAHVLMGSVAERVLRQAPCPVLTVRIASPKAEV